MPFQQKKFTKLPGFFFAPGHTYSTFDAQPIATALFGPNEDYEDYEILRNRCKTRIAGFFTTLLDYEHLYRAVRGGKLFWETVTKFWGDTPSDLEPRNAKALASAWSLARGNYAGVVVSTELTSLVDRWIQCVNQTAALPPAAGQIQLSVRTHPTDVQSLSNQMASSGLGQAVNNDSAWPPSYISDKDIPILAGNVTRSYLQGITPANNGKMPTTPTVYSHPLTIHIILGWLLLILSDATSNWALYLTPIAFLNNKNRQSWYDMSAKKSKLYGTLDSFFSYAGHAFKNRNKTTIVALLTPWMLPAGQVLTLAPKDAQGSPDLTTFWSSHHLAARMGLALVLRRMNWGLQVVIFDPWSRYPDCKEAVKAHTASVFGFRSTLITTLRQWAQHNGVPKVEVLWGGYILNIWNGSSDSVTLSTLFVARAVEGTLLPEGGFENPEWKKLGFERLEG